jgi:hypothetical protein
MDNIVPEFLHLVPDFMLKMPFMNPKGMSTLGHTFRYDGSDPSVRRHIANERAEISTKRYLP